MTHDQLDALWTRTHSRLLLLANGPATSFDPKISQGETEDKAPRTFHQDIAELEAEWDRAYSKKAKRRTIEQALEMVFYHSPRSRQKAAFPHMPANAQDQYRKTILDQALVQQRKERTKEWREAVAFEDGTIEQVAALYGEPRETVRRWRHEVQQRNGGLPRTHIGRSTYEFIQKAVRDSQVLGKPDSA